MTDTVHSAPESAGRRDPAPRRRKLLWGAGALALLAVIYLLLSTWGGDTSTLLKEGELTYTVTRGDLVISFTERGNVEAASSIPIYCQVEGRNTITYIVPEGTHVKEGDLLVEIDSSTLTQQLNQQEISVESARAALHQAREQLVIQESLNQSAIDTAQLNVELARLDLEKYRDGDYPLARDKAQQDIFIAEEELARAKNKYEWTKKLAERGYVNLMELQADKLAVSKAEVAYKQALGQFQLLERYTHKRELKTYENNLKQAEAALERTKRQASAEMAQAEADVRAKESTYKLSLERFEKLKDQLAKTKIYAPGSGMVVYANPSRGRGREEILEAGAEVYENQLLMKLPDVSKMLVEIKVQEAWIDQVHEGQVALVTVDPLPNLTFRGRVTRVGMLPDYVNRWLNPDLKVYETKIEIEEGQDTSQLRPGMSAQAQVIIAQLKDVLYVPVQSVTTIDGEQVCYVWNGSEFRPQKVVTGQHNDSFIHIVSGLKEGDVIQLNAPPPEGKSKEEELEGIELPVAEAAGAAEPVPAVVPGGERGRGGSRAGGPGRFRRGGGEGGRGEAQPASARAGEGGGLRGRRLGEGRPRRRDFGGARPERRGPGDAGRQNGRAAERAAGDAGKSRSDTEKTGGNGRAAQ